MNSHIKQIILLRRLRNIQHWFAHPDCSRLFVLKYPPDRTCVLYFYLKYIGLYLPATGFLRSLWGGEHNHPLYPELSPFSFWGEAEQIGVCHHKTFLFFLFESEFFKIWILLGILWFYIQGSQSPFQPQCCTCCGWSISSTLGPHHAFFSDALLPGMPRTLYL